MPIPIYSAAMPTADVHAVDDRFDRVAAIERLLEQYRATKNRRLLRRAIELFDELEAERQQTRTGRTQIH